MFTVLFDKHSYILRRLLELYYPQGCSVIDFTAGQGRLHVDLPARYRVTLCDRAPGHQYRKDLTKDDYNDVGMHDCGVFDPPYLVQRLAFDYPAKKTQTWRRKVSRMSGNQSLEEFNERVRALNVKALQCVRRLLLVKIMDPRIRGQLVPHHCTIWEALDCWRLIDLGVYIRQGATTWIIKKGLQNAHGFWMVFERKDW
jgi:hypothetical protein